MIAKNSLALWSISVIGLLLVVVGCAPTLDSNVNTESNTVGEQAPVSLQTEYYESLLSGLKSNEDVLPPRPRGTVRLYNREAVIPPQCYTKTEGKYNPCYICHQYSKEGRENRLNDGHLQLAYSFSDEGQTNRWQNLFEDRSQRAEQISDEAIQAWTKQDNFSALAKRLDEKNFRGYVPRLENLALGAAAFDETGMALDGSHWVAFNYKPVPSTFWPTNGATDDVMIRLPEAFRTNERGEYSLEIYRANLALVEAAIKGVDEIGTLPIDEQALGRDINGDGRLSVVKTIKRTEFYLGAAAKKRLVPSIYPKGTEFLHTVRYIGVDDNGEIYNAERMKEVRYMRKRDILSTKDLGHYYDEEYQEKLEGNLPEYPDRGQSGVYNKMGWLLQGFIEDKQGQLRYNTYEETMFCMGCHNAVGSTIDKTFSFARKIDGEKGWGYIDLKGMPDVPNMGETDGEIMTYLSRVGGGTEFRNNDEMAERWYHTDGSVKREQVAAADVYELITPSPERALALNKAYKVIVEDQDFIFGRDPVLSPPTNVYDFVDNEDSPTLPGDKFFTWDIRLNWSALTGQFGDQGVGRISVAPSDNSIPVGEAGRRLRLSRPTSLRGAN